MLLYCAHPLGYSDTREDNLDLFQDWFAWLLQKHPNDALVAPWVLYARVLEETDVNRARGIRDDLTTLAYCDGIILCGERISEGMLEELTRYIKRRAEAGLPINVFNYTGTKLP